MEKNIYAIVGASGNTGHVVASKLLDQGQDVRVIGRHSDRLQPLAKRGAKAVLADATDRSALARAFDGVRAVYAMIPPNLGAPDARDYQNRVVDATAGALEKARVPFVVALSSYGADKDSGTGPVAGLHHLEERIKQIANINSWFIRAGYFMENTLPQAQLVKQFGSLAGPLKDDLELPMIATRDIGAFAAEKLVRLDFTGHNAHELQGNRDITYTEATAIIAQAIGKSDLKYTRLPYDQVRAFFLQMGASPSFGDLMVEMFAALDSGHMRALEPRTPANTTPTSYEQFVKEYFVPAYQGASQAA